MTTRPRTAAALALTTALLIAGCTGGGSDDETPDPAAANDAEVAAESADPGAADVADEDSVLAEQTVDAPGSAGGTLAVTLRSLEVRGDVTTVRWSLRWDSDDAADDETARHFDLGIGWVPTVTDTEALVLYKPFCTDGSWQEGAISQQQCSFSITGAPRHGFSGFVNHATVEAWASLPAPEGKPDTLDVALSDGLPAFTGVTVAYAEGQG